MIYRFSLQEVSKNYSEFNKKFKNKHCEKKNRDGKDTSTYVNTVIQLLIYILYGSANSFDLHPRGTD